MVMPYHLHMPSYFLETFTEYPYLGQFIKPMIDAKIKIMTNYLINYFTFPTLIKYSAI